MLQTEQQVTHVIGERAASSYIARHCGGPVWFERVSAFEDCRRRGMGPEPERVTGGEPVFSTADLVAWTITVFGAGDEDDRKAMLGRYLGGDGELVWRSGTATVELVDFDD